MHHPIFSKGDSRLFCMSRYRCATSFDSLPLFSPSNRSASQLLWSSDDSEAAERFHSFSCGAREPAFAWLTASTARQLPRKSLREAVPSNGLQDLCPPLVIRSLPLVSVGRSPSGKLSNDFPAPTRRALASSELPEPSPSPPPEPGLSLGLSPDPAEA